MRIAIVSDCQFSNRPGDFADFSLPDADVVVVAGDFYPSLHRSLVQLDKLAKGRQVVYVAGNRDFYGEDHDTALKSVKGLALHDVHFLQDESVVIDGVRFAGATLWTDYGLSGKLVHCRDELFGKLSDHSVIRKGSRDWWPEDAYASHKASLAFFETTLSSSSEPVVLVSHHAPSPRSSSTVHKTLHGAFASDLSHLMNGPHAPVMWVHGATHRAVDYQEGGTRVVSNPLGYIGERTGYIKDLVVELASPAMGASPG